VTSKFGIDKNYNYCTYLLYLYDTSYLYDYDYRTTYTYVSEERNSKELADTSHVTEYLLCI
jgi:hypothetical protein